MDRVVQVINEGRREGPAPVERHHRGRSERGSVAVRFDLHLAHGSDEWTRLIARLVIVLGRVVLCPAELTNAQLEAVDEAVEPANLALLLLECRFFLRAAAGSGGSASKWLKVCKCAGGDARRSVSCRPDARNASRLALAAVLRARAAELARAAL